MAVVEAAFFDGERSTTIGSVAIYAAMNFQNLLTILSKKIGISSQQFSVYLSNRVTRGPLMQVSHSTDFLALSHSRPDTWDLIVVLNRSSSETKSKNLKPTPPAAMDYHENSAFQEPTNNGNNLFDRPANTMPWRSGENNTTRHECDPVGHQDRMSLQKESTKHLKNLGPGLGHDSQARLKTDRERYRKNMGLPLDSGFWQLDEPDLRSNGEVKNVVACEGCERNKRNGTDGEFHLCVNDSVIHGFRSKAGPVTRPTKKPPERPHFG